MDVAVSSQAKLPYTSTTEKPVASRSQESDKGLMDLSSEHFIIIGVSSIVVVSLIVNAVLVAKFKRSKRNRNNFAMMGPPLTEGLKASYKAGSQTSIATTGTYYEINSRSSSLNRNLVHEYYNLPSISQSAPVYYNMKTISNHPYYNLPGLSGEVQLQRFCSISHQHLDELTIENRGSMGVGPADLDANTSEEPVRYVVVTPTRSQELPKEHRTSESRPYVHGRSPEVPEEQRITGSEHHNNINRTRFQQMPAERRTFGAARYVDINRKRSIQARAEHASGKPGRYIVNSPISQFLPSGQRASASIQYVDVNRTRPDELPALSRTSDMNHESSLKLPIRKIISDSLSKVDANANRFQKLPAENRKTEQMRFVDVNRSSSPKTHMGRQRSCTPESMNDTPGQILEPINAVEPGRVPQDYSRNYTSRSWPRESAVIHDDINYTFPVENEGYQNTTFRSMTADGFEATNASRPFKRHYSLPRRRVEVVAPQREQSDPAQTSHMDQVDYHLQDVSRSWSRSSNTHDQRDSTFRSEYEGYETNMFHEMMTGRVNMKETIL